MRFEGESINDVWEQLVAELATSPEASPRGMKVRELTGVQMHVRDSRRNVFVSERRRLNYRFMVAEWLWIWFGRDDVATIAQYNRNVAQFSDDGLRFYGAYGPRIRRSWDAVRDKLRAVDDPDTRQAVVQIYEQRDAGAVTKDTPCTLGFQFLARGGRLHAVVTMRSNDVWLGLPYDFFNFTQLQATMAAEVGMPAGPITVNVGSSHLYEQHWEPAKGVLDDPYRVSMRSPDLSSGPPASMEWTLVNRAGGSDDVRPWRQYSAALRAEKSADALASLAELA